MISSLKRTVNFYTFERYNNSVFRPTQDCKTDHWVEEWETAIRNVGL